ncbi:MAG: hypothetical protein NTX50_10855 [Candidatus Sumerlaeota bacterium]|nr:hypothetical protein [Candidatus Sumerlaeota bacterium]
MKKTMTVADMKIKGKGKRRLTEGEIDELVVRQADDESAWDAPIRVKRKTSRKDEFVR